MLFNVLKIATDHVDTLMDHVKIVKQVGRVLIAQKVINKEYFENPFCDFFLSRKFSLNRSRTLAQSLVIRHSYSVFLMQICVAIFFFNS